MSDELKNTIRFRRANQGDGDTSGSAATTEMSEFELVSTQMLEKILVAKDDAPKNRIRDLADYEDGWPPSPTRKTAGWRAIPRARILKSSRTTNSSGR